MIQGGIDGHKARGLTRSETGAKRTARQHAIDFLAGMASIIENFKRKSEEINQALGRSQTKGLPERASKRLAQLIKANPAIVLGIVLAAGFAFKGSKLYEQKGTSPVSAPVPAPVAASPDPAGSTDKQVGGADAGQEGVTDNDLNLTGRDSPKPDSTTVNPAAAGSSSPAITHKKYDNKKKFPAENGAIGYIQSIGQGKDLFIRSSCGKIVRHYSD